MFVVERGVGRVVHAKVTGLASAAEVEDYRLAFQPHLRAIEAGGERPVLWADHRAVRIYAQPVADAITRMFTSLNVHWLRVAILVAQSNATLAMQLTRIARESENASRQVFFESERAFGFLAEILTADELAGVRAFAAK